VIRQVHPEQMIANLGTKLEHQGIARADQKELADERERLQRQGQQNDRDANEENR